MTTNNLTEHEQLFFNDGFRLGQEAAKQIKNEDAFLKRIEDMHLAIDQLIDSLLAMAQKQGVAVDCKKGCAWCCHQAVFANSYEVHYLGAYIRKNFKPLVQEDILQQAINKNEQIGELTDEEVLKFKSPCPLLKDGACSAYHARPMACRIYLSMNISSCVEFYKNPENEENYPALFDFPLSAGRMMNEGFIEALKESEIFITEFRLEEGLKTFLTKGSNL